MTHESVAEKPSTPSTSRFKVTGVPESELPAAALASAFKPAAVPAQTPDNASNNAATSTTTTRDDVEGLSRRPTTIPIDPGHASRRGSINDTPSASEHTPANVVRKASDRQIDVSVAPAAKSDADPDASEVDAIHDLKEELKSGGISPLSRQVSKKEDVPADPDSEGSGTEEG